MSQAVILSGWERATLHLKTGLTVWERIGLAEEYDKAQRPVLTQLVNPDNPFRYMRGNYVKADEPIVPVNLRRS